MNSLKFDEQLDYAAALGGGQWFGMRYKYEMGRKMPKDPKVPSPIGGFTGFSLEFTIGTRVHRK